MSFFSNNLPPSSLVFIPNLLKPPAAANNTRSTLHPACPTRHPLAQYALIPSPSPSRVPPVAVLSRNPTSSTSTASPIVNLSPPPTLQPFPLLDVSTSPLDSSLHTSDSLTPINHPTPFITQPAQRRGHRHTEESRRKIGIANRGNTPWNKGRRHSEETKRKIAENTKRAMLKPEMRQMLQQRARGRRHTEATKLKIRETARLTRGTSKGTKRRQKKTPVPYAFAPNVVKRLNACIAKQIEDSFEQDTHQEGSKYIIRERRVVSEETRQKLSRRIKEMWSDPDYRSRVASGIEERSRRLAEKEKTQTSDNPSQLTENDTSRSSTKRRPRLKSKAESGNANESNPVRPKRIGKGSANNADIVLDSDSLQGWTKEDLGIVGTHGAGRIDEDIIASTKPFELPSQEDTEDSFSPESHRSLRLETAANTETSYEDHTAFSFENSNSKLTSPAEPAAQDLNFSRLDIATEYTLPNSYGIQADFLEEQVPSFNHEPRLDNGSNPGDPFDQINEDDYFSGSSSEKAHHDPFQYVGSDRSLDLNRPCFNFPEEDPSMFERF